MVCSDAQSRLESERVVRQRAESSLLDMEKHISNMTVDFQQLEQSKASLAHDLHSEMEKVHTMNSVELLFKLKILC